MVCDDNVQPVVPGPIKWIVCPNAAVNAKRYLISFGYCALQRRLLYSVALGESMRHMEPGARAEHVECTRKHRSPSRPVYIVVAVNKNRLLFVDRPQQTRHGLSHTLHEIRIVQVIVGRI